MDKLRWCLFMICLGSYGLAQIMKTERRCGKKLPSSCNNKPLNPRIFLECQSHHVILLTDVSFVTFNETDEETCCVRLPKHFCNADRSYHLLERGMVEILNCNMKPICFLHRLSRDLYGVTSIPNNCAARSFMLYYNYICTTNSTIVNMTNPGENENNGEISLTYNWIPRYPRINGSFHCLCEITASDDVAIYPILYYLHLQWRHRSSMYISSRNQNLAYNSKSTDISGLFDLFYERIHHIRGPLYLVYTGKDLPSADKLWISFKVVKGRIKTRCDGCKTGKFTPPEGNVQIIQGALISSEINTKSQLDSLGSGQMDTTYRIAFITLVVVFSLGGNILTVVYIICRQKRLDRENIGRGEATVSLNVIEGDTNRDSRNAGNRRDVPTVRPPTEEEWQQDDYDALDLANIYDDCQVQAYSN